MKKTYTQKSAEIRRDWHQIDVTNKILGRAAQEVAKLLLGKQKPTYTPHIDAGDYVIVINAEKVRLSSNKKETKTYFRHSSYPGGDVTLTFNQLMAKDATKPFVLAVKGMLPKNKLRADRMKRLKVYAGFEHPHQSHFSNKKQTKKD